jgi:hypothetical protein
MLNLSKKALLFVMFAYHNLEVRHKINFSLLEEELAVSRYHLSIPHSLDETFNNCWVYAIYVRHYAKCCMYNNHYSGHGLCTYEACGLLGEISIKYLQRYMYQLQMKIFLMNLWGEGKCTVSQKIKNDRSCLVSVWFHVKDERWAGMGTWIREFDATMQVRVQTDHISLGQSLAICVSHTWIFNKICWKNGLIKK